MSNNINESILVKIKNALKKADPNSGATEAEAQSSMLMAQKLMAKHGIDLSDVADVSTEKLKKEVQNTAGDLRAERRVWWKGRLSIIIGRNFRCEPYFSKTGRGLNAVVQVRFIGIKEDAEIAVEVYRYASDIIEYYSKKYLKQRKREINKKNGIDFKKMSIEELEDYAVFEAGMSRYAIAEVKDKYPNPDIYKMRLSMAIKDHLGISINPSAIKNDYIDGFLDGLDAKFKEQVAANCFELVLRVDPAVTEAVEALELKNSPRSSAKALGDYEAKSAGFKQGKQFDGPPKGKLNEGKRQIRGGK